MQPTTGSLGKGEFIHALQYIAAVSAAMGTPAAAAWQKAVKLLQGCSTRQTDRGEADAAVEKVYIIINKMRHPGRRKQS